MTRQVGGNDVSPTKIEYSQYQVDPPVISQWNISRDVFVIYRAVAFLYWTTISVICFVMSDYKQFYFIYLTHLDQLCIVIYLALALASALCYRGDNDRVNDDDEKSISFVASHRRDDKDCNRTRSLSHKPKLLHRCTLAMHVVCFNVALIVTVLYPLLEGTKYDVPYNSYNFFNIHIHVVNFVIMFVDVALASLSVYPCQVVFATAFSAGYAIILTLLHVTGTNSAVYDVINYEDGPLKAWIITAVMILIAPVFSHSVMCCLHRLKLTITRCRCLPSSCLNAPLLPEARPSETSSADAAVV